MSSLTQHGGRPRRGGRFLTVGAVGVALVATSLTTVATAAHADTLPTSLIDTATTTWSFSDNNTDPAAGAADRLAWTQADFDDSAWKTGTGAFGAKNGQPTGIGANFPINTLLNHYINGTSFPAVKTYHFRSDFTVTAAQIEASAALRGQIVFDDAVQIFVNGTQVAGFVDERVAAAPAAERNLTYAGASGGNPVSSTFTVPTDVLVDGANTLAVALYQDRDTSSDIYLDVKSLTPLQRSEPTDIVLGIGADETQRNLNWYSLVDTAQVAQIAPTAQLVNGALPATALTVPATGGPTTSGEFNRFATLGNLQANTSYSYRVGSEDSGWSSVATFRTQDFSGDYKFLLFGDPQIGASGNVTRDKEGWIDTLNVATAAHPDAEILFSAGDQVEHAGSEEQYEALFTPTQMRSLPFVPTNGNHDVGSKAYEQHYFTPNLDRTAGAGSATSSGGNYWFLYKDVLFMNLNSNSTDYESHARWLRQVVADQGDKAKWKVAAFHHSVYSAGPHSITQTIANRRAALPTVLSEVGVDLVLQGHDHSYARSFLMKNGEKADPAEPAGAETLIPGPGGVLYVTANSSSGSKYYSLQPQHSYLSVYNQENVRNYSTVEVSDDAITVKTLRSQAKDADKPVNSVVDQVTIEREPTVPADNEQLLQVVVPEQAEGEFLWNIDGTNKLVDFGTATENGDHYAATGTLNPIRVTDTRRAAPAWAVSAQVGDFTSNGVTFSGRHLGWTPAVVENGGGVVAGAPIASKFDGGQGLAQSAVLGSAADGHVRGSAVLGAGLDLKIPTEVTDGTYQATLTLTALS